MDSDLDWDWIGLDWIGAGIEFGLGLDWVGLGLDWIGLDWIGLGLGLDLDLDWGLGWDWIGAGMNGLDKVREYWNWNCSVMGVREVDGFLELKRCIYQLLRP